MFRLRIVRDWRGCRQLALRRRRQRTIERVASAGYVVDVKGERLTRVLRICEKRRYDSEDEIGPGFLE